MELVIHNGDSYPQLYLFLLQATFLKLEMPSRLRRSSRFIYIGKRHYKIGRRRKDSSSEKPSSNGPRRVKTVVE
jgi:hypothetical protein